MFIRTREWTQVTRVGGKSAEHYTDASRMLGTYLELLHLLYSIYVLAGRNPLSRLPSSVSDAWLDTLPLVTAPTEAIHYQGRQLDNTIKQLSTAMRRDDPIEEYKVG